MPYSDSLAAQFLSIHYDITIFQFLVQDPTEGL
jgi:hypothetical protein